MKLFYVLPTAVLDANRPNAIHHATSHPVWSLVVVEQWLDPTDQDTWEALPGVRPLHPEMWGTPVPTPLVTAFGSLGVTATDTVRDAMQKIRVHWSPARH